MYKEVLRSIDGVDIYPVLSLIIFGLFFTALLVYVIKEDKSFIQHMKELPLREGDATKSGSIVNAEKQ